MKKLIFIAALISLFSCSFLYSAHTQDQDVNVTLRQLEGELSNLRVPVSDINSITPVLRNLLNQGATKGDLMNMMSSMAKKGLIGKELYTYFASMSTLIEAGAEAGEAGDVVLQAIDQGLAYGFKGGDLGLTVKVQEIIEKKKAQLLEEKMKEASEKAKAK